MTEKLVNKKLNQLREYNSPNIELNNLQTNDALNASMFGPDEIYHDFMYKVADNNKAKEQQKKQSFTQKYPNGLPIEVLKQISFTRFGAMLKQNNLLPPSYDRKPIKIEIDENYDKPRVILTFKSKNSDNSRTVSIYGYSVAYSERVR